MHQIEVPDEPSGKLQEYKKEDPIVIELKKNASP